LVKAATVERTVTRMIRFAVLTWRDSHQIGRRDGPTHAGPAPTAAPLRTCPGPSRSLPAHARGVLVVLPRPVGCPRPRPPRPDARGPAPAARRAQARGRGRNVGPRAPRRGAP